MYYTFNKTILAFLSLSFSWVMFQEAAFEDSKKALMIQDLTVIKHHFEAGYAPANWKKEHTGWDLNEAFEDAKKQVLATSSISTKQFHQILRNFMNSMSDYHVDVSFFSTESASLPFSVKGIEGRCFIDWVDPIRLPATYFGIRAGDELLRFDERPIADVIDEIEKTAGKSANPNTDRALAEMKLTVRTGRSGDVVPSGPINVITSSAETGRVSKHQLRWNYTPEHVKNPLDFITTLDFISWLNVGEKEESKIDALKLIMANPMHQEIAMECADRDGGLGSRKSFLPPFGEVVWSNDEVSAAEDAQDESLKNERNEDAEFWHAYVFNHPQGHKVGYIRIPHYTLSLGQVEEFGKIVSTMDQLTDLLVVDQLHNFGGYVHIQYLLASMLTDQPLQAPYHRIKITQKEALDAYKTLQLISLIERKLDSMDPDSSDSDNPEQKDVGFNFQELLFLKAYCELVLEDWNKGKNMTTPTPILGVDKINPHPNYRYTKPIVMLINEMDFSGGDFMPAVMQDNQRALLFGARTAGAGGYVFSFQFPNSNGIASCSYTASIAERVNLQKIENLGVTPDVPYELTLEDVQRGYQGYVDAANQAIHNLIEGGG